MFQTPQGSRNVRLASPSGGIKQSQFSMRNNNSQQTQPSSSSSSKTNKLPKLLNDEKGSTQDTPVIDVGVCSLQGRRPYQEDQFAVCRFLKDPTSQSENTPETHFFGVFDGHAGGKCSKAICTTIPYQFCRDESFLTKIPIALRKAIQRTNEQFLEVAGRMRLNDGSTAVCVVLRGLTMTISNVGDSRAVLISGKKGITLTEDHKPSLPSEQKRIASFGGTVTYNTGIARVAGVLAVSRAFGNYSIRNLIRADPDITERELTSQDDFVVLASDGLWDVFSANEVAEVCYSWQRYGVSRIADQLVQLALTRGSMDNVTAIVVSLSKYISRMIQQQQQSHFQYNSNNNSNNNSTSNLNSQQSQQSQQGYENGSKQRAATASSVMTASLRPDSGYGRRKNDGNETNNNTNNNINNTNNNNNDNNNNNGRIYQDKEDDDTLIGDDATITEYETTIIGISSARGSRSGTPTNDRKLTILPTNFNSSSNDSSNSFITPVQTKRLNNNNSNNNNNNLSTIPLYTNNTNNLNLNNHQNNNHNNHNNNNNNMKKSSTINNNNNHNNHNNNNSLSTTLPPSTVPSINSNGVGGGIFGVGNNNNNNNNQNNNNNNNNGGSSGGGGGSLFSKTLGAKPDPPLERIYSPIISPAYRKGSLTHGTNRPNTTR